MLPFHNISRNLSLLTEERRCQHVPVTTDSRSLDHRIAAVAIRWKTDRDAANLDHEVGPSLP